MIVKNISNFGNIVKYNLLKICFWVFWSILFYDVRGNWILRFKKLRVDLVKIVLVIFNELVIIIVFFKFKIICFNSIFLVLILVVLVVR